MSPAQPNPKPPLFEVRVRGRLGETIQRAFTELSVESDGRVTLLRGALTDQSELYGVLAQIEALGVELLEVRRIPPD